MTDKYLFIASEVRSGSTYIAELLTYSLHESFGMEFWDLPKELLRSLDDRSTSSDVRELVTNLWLNGSGYRSAKIMCAQLSIISRAANVDPALKDLMFGENTAWIVVRRRNRIRQAVSLALADRSGIYHSYDASSSSAEAGSISMGEVNDALRAILLSDEYLKTFFSALPTKKAMLYYEDVLSREKEHLETIAELLGLPNHSDNLTVATPKLQRTDNEYKREIERLYKAWFLENNHPTISD